MRKLHLVGFTTDLEGLIFSARKGAKTGSFVVPLGEELVDTIAEAQRLRNGDESGGPPAPNSQPERRRLRAESALTPREIQARIRAGRSVEDVAVEAGVDLDWIERFAVPILAEQARVIEQARAATYSKPRRGESALPLGPSVAQNLSMRGAAVLPDVFDAAWAAHHLHDGVWMIRFRYRSRGRAHEATWTLEVPTNNLLAANRLGSELGYVDKLRHQAVVNDDGEAVEPDGADAAPMPRRRRAPSTKKVSVKKGPAKRAPARKAPAKKAAVRKVTARKAPVTKTRSRTPAPKPTRPAGRKGATPRPGAASRKAVASRKAAATRSGQGGRKAAPGRKGGASHRAATSPRNAAPRSGTASRTSAGGRSRAASQTRPAPGATARSRAGSTSRASTAPSVVTARPMTSTRPSAGDAPQIVRRPSQSPSSSRSSPRAVHEAPVAAPASTDRRAVVSSDGRSAPAAEPARRLGGAIALGPSAREAEPARVQAEPDTADTKVPSTGFRARISAHRASELADDGSGSGARRRDPRPREKSVRSTVLAPA